MTKRTEFSAVRERGRAKAGRFLILSTLEDAGLEGLRVGFITTRKVGKAHERNLLRRRFRSILHRHGEHLVGSRRYLVTIARASAKGAGFEELEKDWLKQARRLGILGGETE